MTAHAAQAQVNEYLHDMVTMLDAYHMSLLRENHFLEHQNEEKLYRPIARQIYLRDRSKQIFLILWLATALMVGLAVVLGFQTCACSK